MELKAGKELRIRSKPLSVESLGLGQAPKPRVEARACSVSAFSLSPRVHASAPDGCSPRALGRSRRGQSVGLKVRNTWSEV
jgi:hypothetical protein